MFVLIYPKIKKILSKLILGLGKKPKYRDYPNKTFYPSNSLKPDINFIHFYTFAPHFLQITTIWVAHFSHAYFLHFIQVLFVLLTLQYLIWQDPCSEEEYLYHLLFSWAFFNYLVLFLIFGLSFLPIKIKTFSLIFFFRRFFI